MDIWTWPAKGPAGRAPLCEFCSNGSLQRHLGPRPPKSLNWRWRINCAFLRIGRGGSLLLLCSLCLEIIYRAVCSGWWFMISFLPGVFFPKGWPLLIGRQCIPAGSLLFSAWYSSVGERHLASLCVVRPLLPFGFAVTESIISSLFSPFLPFFLLLFWDSHCI